jgi:hypothetical protein
VHRRIAIELIVVLALFAVVGFVWLHPASQALLAGDARTMIGDGTDSVTIPWQYHLVLDTFRDAPSRLLFGGIYSDQVTAPDGYAVYIPYSERVFVLLLAPFMRADLMPTAVVWAYVALSGVSMYVCGRVLGWPRTIAFALAVAWAICPYTRARSVVHNAMVGVYFAPLVVAGIRLVAGSPRRLGWSSRTDMGVAALLFVCAVGAAHYYAFMLIGFAPAFIALYVVFLPRGSSRLRSAWRLVLAALPALLLLAWTRVMPTRPSDAHRFAAVERSEQVVRRESDNFLRWYGARASQYVAGDVRFGDRDVLPWRSAVTAEVRREFGDNLHERTNGIRWTLLAASVVLLVVVTFARLRRRLSADERRLAMFALAFGGAAFLVSLSPQGVRYYDVDLGPSLILARLIPAFRVPNRVGVFVHFAAILCTGVLFAGLAKRVRRAWRGEAIGGALLALVVVEYLPLHPVLKTTIPAARSELVPPSGACGGGLLLPYASWEANEARYYRAMTEVRGTSCKLVHGNYLASEEPALRSALSVLEPTPSYRERAVAFARCTRASWTMFSSDAPDEFRRAFCADMGWTFVAPDACRSAGPVVEPRSARECL